MKQDTDMKRLTSMEIVVLIYSAITLIMTFIYWNKLPAYVEGEVGTEAVYTVAEITAITGYTTTYSTDTFEITNTHTPETTTYTMTKVWDDGNNQDNTRGKYTVQLYANGEACGNAVELEATTTTYTWTDLPKYEAGKEIIYTVDETAKPEGYTKTVDGSKITNSYTPETTTYTVTKVWDDANNQDNKRGKYTVQLYANGKAYGDAVELEATTTTYTWENLPKNADGVAIVYTVDETAKPEGYTKSVSGSTITNSYTPKTVEKTVTKITLGSFSFVSIINLSLISFNKPI